MEDDDINEIFYWIMPSVCIGTGILMFLIDYLKMPAPFVAFFMIGLVVGIMSYFAKKSSTKKGTLSSEEKSILQGFAFYQTLTKTEQQEFEKRVAFITHNKAFVGRQDLSVTPRMKVLIAATFAQIGFGFNFISFEDFDKIIIFPKAYYSKHTGRHHKGEVNSAGVIMLSWADFLEGYNISDDGYNVGLHEVAHALRLEDAMPGEEYHFLKETDLSNWNRVAEREYNAIRAGNTSFIRSYAGTNRQEFFAVCVEQFFEQPQAFYDALPSLYKALAQLMKQDPLKRKWRTLN
jgi:MtfA peptidase